MTKQITCLKLILAFTVVLSSFFHGRASVQFDEKSPKQYVEAAARNLTSNYIKDKYSSTAFLRLYKQMNGEFRQLTEIQSSILFNLEVPSKGYSGKQAIAVKNVRTTRPDVIPYYQNFDFGSALALDPVSNPYGSILDPKVIRYAEFEFEPDFSYDYVVIRYSIPDFSTEIHWIDYEGFYTKSGLTKETGRITMNRESFVITKIEREVAAKQPYTPKDRRYIVSKKSPYAEELVVSKLVLEYADFFGSHFLRKLYYKREVNLYKAGNYTHLGNFVIFREYHFGAPSNVVSPDLKDQFVVRPAILKRPCSYDPSKWRLKLPDYYFESEKDVYFSLERYQPVEEQFQCTE
jgi:hypothetical protein